jgi:hypothetical protein
LIYFSIQRFCVISNVFWWLHTIRSLVLRISVLDLLACIYYIVCWWSKLYEFF